MSETRTYDLLPSETVMSDDAPVHPRYVYICDNVFTRYENMMSTTIADWKRRQGIKEIRRCDLFDHGDARLGDRVVAHD